MSFVITLEWLHAHKTVNGGWTSPQLEAVGIAWPPKSGWMRSLVGLTITPEQKERFEALSGRRDTKRTTHAEDSGV